MVESAIGAHLLNHSMGGAFELSYWREGNDEVDFVIASKQMMGIEVKSGATQRLSGINAFKKMHHPDKMLLVGTEGLTWQEFLKMNPLDLIRD